MMQKSKVWNHAKSVARTSAMMESFTTISNDFKPLSNVSKLYTSDVQRKP